MRADDAARARRFAARAALAGCALVFAVVVTSAYLRLGGAGPGLTGLAGAARIVHRLAASVEAVLVVMLAAVCWRARRQWARGAWAAAVIAALSLALAVLGIATTERAPPTVQLGNFLGGMALLGAFGWLARQAQEPAPPAPAARWLWAGIALLALQIALGGLVSVQQAAASCPALPLCEEGWRPARADPQRPASRHSSPAAAPTQSAQRALHMAHRAGAAIVFAYWIALAGLLRHRAPSASRQAAALAAMLFVQALLGAGVVASGAAPAAALAHNAWAALTLLAAVLCGRANSSPRRR
ncbi:MAG TPA: COX15/CtaA family protein [Burkholderiales bacterium]|nr:COX15/CtaA family protein [Burkholderiales bacterium]